jgi:formate hydrogenlyase transcriptional activator
VPPSGKNIYSDYDYEQAKKMNKKAIKGREGRISLLEESFENFPVGLIILDKEGRVIWVNRRQEEISKVNRQNVLEQLFHESWKNLFDQRSTGNQTFGNNYWNLIKNKKPYTFVFHGVAPQFYSEKISGIAYGLPIFSGEGFLLVHEISEEMKQDKHVLEKINQQLSKSHSFLENLLDASPNAVVTTDGKGLIQTVNKTAEKLFGYSNKEFLWMPISVLFAKGLELEKIKKLSNIRDGIEVTCVKRDGELFPTRMQIGAFKDMEHNDVSTLFLFRDISREKAMEITISERLKFESCISELSSKFINIRVDRIDREIEAGLKILAETLDIDFSALAQFSNDNNVLTITHYYNNVDFPFYFEGDFCQRFPWYAKRIRAGEMTSFSYPEELPEDAAIERKYCITEGHRSHLGMPMMIGDDLLGLLMFSSIEKHRAWPEELIKRLKLVTEIFSNALLRRRSEESLNRAFSQITTLKNRLEAERNYLRDEIRMEHNFENIIGQSDALLYSLFKVQQVAPTDATVLVLGETGTGKELIVRAIHHTSRRKNHPLIKVNCATLPSNIIESELFGHEKGAFTGAHVQRIGRFELADGATIFLDEIGELPLDLQAKLLRVLQEGEFERLGSSRTLKVDARIIAATNRELESEVRNGRFREDLWYRLNVFPITVPALRQRKEDIQLLVNWFVKKFNKKLGRQINIIPMETMKMLEEYSWPGNIRELENVIERCVINSRGNVFEMMESRPFIHMDQSNIQKDPSEKMVKKSLAEMEKDYITDTLNETRWKVEGKGGAAKILDLPSSTLRGRMAKLGIRRPELQ